MTRRTTKPAAGGSVAVQGRPRPAVTAELAAQLVGHADEEPWTTEEVDEVVAELTQQRERLLRTIEAQQVELNGLMRDAGDGAGHDVADVGATAFERDHEIVVMNTEIGILATVERVLAKVTDGTLGVCEGCGEPIGKMRVMAFPRATLCLTCKQREERR